MEDDSKTPAPGSALDLPEYPYPWYADTLDDLLTHILSQKEGLVWYPHDNMHEMLPALQRVKRYLTLLGREVQP